MISSKYIVSLILVVFCFYYSTSQKLNFIPIIDSIHNKELSDKYYELENFQRPEVIKWLKKQNQKSKKHLNGIPKVEHLLSLQIQNSQKYQDNISYITRVKNGDVFYIKNDVLNNENTLFVNPVNKNVGIKIYSSSEFKPSENKKYLINYIKPSWDGKKIVISLNYSGKEASELVIFDLDKNQLLSNSISSAKPTIGGVFWLPDNSSFLYTEVDETKENTSKNNLDTKVKRYQLTKEQSTNFFSRENNPEIEIKQEDFPIVYIDHNDDQYFIGSISSSSPYPDTYYCPIKEAYNNSGKQNWIPLFKKNEKITYYFQQGDSLIYLTAKGASNFKICKTSIKNPNFNSPEILVNEKNDEIIKSFVLTKAGVFYFTLQNGVKARLYFLDHKKCEKEIKLPFATGYINLHSYGSSENYISVTLQGWLTNKGKYLYDIETGSLVPDRNSNLTSRLANKVTENLIVEELEVTSHDGEKIPLSLIYKKGLKLNGNNSIIMRGYGAYGRSMPPIYHYGFLLPALENGIYAVAHVRGGGEKGDAWYKAGKKQNKINSWKDLIACTEYLIDKKYTSKGRVAIWSASAGGILIGRAMIERPELYGACIIDSGILNPVRSEKGVNGPDLAKEFGTINNATEFKGLLEMDSYYNLKKDTAYPATLIRIGTNDSRVSPWQSAKFAAKLHEFNTSHNPTILYTDFESGHGLNDAKLKNYQKIANAISFAFLHTNHPDYQPIPD